MTERAGPDDSLKVWHLATALVLVVVHLVLVWLTRVPSITVGNDDALYLLLSKSIQNFQYLNAHVVGAPPHGQYPPAYPAFVALWTGLFGGGLDSVLVAGALLSALALVFAFDLGRRTLGTGPAITLLAALAVNPLLIHYAGRIASEPPFMLLVVGAMWVAVAVPDGRRRLVALGTLAILAALTRSIGICLVLGLGLVWLLERRWKAVAVYGVAVMLTVGSWLLWTSVAPGRIVPRSYAATVVKTANRASGEWLGALWDRGITAAEVYGAHSVPSAISVPTISGTSVDNLFWTVVIVITLAAGLVAFWKRLRLLPVFLVLYATLLWIWPHKLTRFVVPVVPLLLIAMLAGLLYLARRWPRGAGILGVALPLVLAVTGLVRDLPHVPKSLACSREAPLTSPACFSEEERNFFVLAEFAEEATDPDATFVTPKEAAFAWYSKRQVYYPGLALKRDSLGIVNTLRGLGLDYVVLTPLHPSAIRDMVRELEPVCGEFEAVTHFGNAWLLRVPAADGAVPQHRSGCEAIEGYMSRMRRRHVAPPLLN